MNAGKVANAARDTFVSADIQRSLCTQGQILTSKKHRQRYQSAMFSLESFHERHKSQEVDERVKESAIDERKGIQSIHCQRDRVSACIQKLEPESLDP